jgi:hypothetical protein
MFSHIIFMLRNTQPLNLLQERESPISYSGLFSVSQDEILEQLTVHIL